MMTNPPQQASDFEYVYNPDGTCHFWYCGKPGKLLVYDDFSSEGGLWFCEECWKDFQGDDASWLTIVEDRRPLVLFFQSVADIAAMCVVENIFHLENAADEDDESRDEEIERLESILDETEYAYIGINNIIYLYKEDDVIAKLDTDDYTWKRADENVDPIAEAEMLIDRVNKALQERGEA